MPVSFQLHALWYHIGSSKSVMLAVLIPHAQLFSCVQIFATLRTIAHQAPLFTGFLRQAYWSVLPFPIQGGSSWPRDQTYVSCVFCISGGFLEIGKCSKSGLLIIFQKAESHTASHPSHSVSSSESQIQPRVPVEEETNFTSWSEEWPRICDHI